MTIIVVVIAGPASDLCRFPVYQGHDRVIRNAAALHTMIVYDVAKSLFTHDDGRQARVYQESGLDRIYAHAGSSQHVAD